MIKHLLSLIIIAGFTLKINLWGAIAVFPFEDLSKDLNGIDFEISTLVANKLVDRGFDVVYPMEIMHFLESKRIPWVGWIDRVNSIKIFKIYHADLIIFGSVLEKNEKRFQLTVCVRMISIPSLKVEWGKIITFSKSKQISFLNLKKRSWRNLLEESIADLVNEIPSLVLTKAMEKPEVDIENVEIYPRFVKKGELVNCKCKLRFSARPPDEIKVKIGKRIVPINISDDNSFQLKIKAPSEEGRYSLTVICKWNAPFNTTKNLFIGSFYVDTTSPQFKLTCKFATKIKGKLYFSKFLKIFPIIKKHEKIWKWKFQIFSYNDNKTITEVKNYGALPRYFIWKGLTSRGAVLPNGKYRITVSLWDKAGNLSREKIDVYLVKTIEPPKVYCEKEDKEKISVIFYFPKHYVPLSICRVEIFDNDGNLIANKTSENKPIEKIEISSRKEKLYYSLTVRDILGNRVIVKKAPLKIERKEKIERPQNIWLKEF